jgi:hypothetical protein
MNQYIYFKNNLKYKVVSYASLILAERPDVGWFRLKHSAIL